MREKKIVGMCGEFAFWCKLYIGSDPGNKYFHTLECNSLVGYDFKILTKKTSVILCHVKSEVYYQLNRRGRGSWVSQSEVFIAGKCELNSEEHNS